MKPSNYSLLASVTIILAIIKQYQCNVNARNVLSDFIDKKSKEEELSETHSRTSMNLAPDVEDKTLTKKETVSKKLDDRIVNFTRVMLPTFENLKINHTVNSLLPGGIEANVTVLSASPLIYEVDGLLDSEECDLLVAIAKDKKIKSIHQHLSPLNIQTVDKLFHDMDFNQDGSITQDEILMLPNLADIKLSMEQVDDMFFMLKMDQDNDGKISLKELQNTDVSKILPYFDQLRLDTNRLRNMSYESAWVWADEDDMLKFDKEGYFEDYHERLSMVTEIPSELWEMSEPLQVKHFSEGQFQIPRHDSEAIDKDLPCCLYGDIDKQCRICRYLSFNIFLSDVEDGGELAFPLANNPFQDVMSNSGEWRGYYIYSKTTGSKTYFTVNLNFTYEGANRIFIGKGIEGEQEFFFRNTLILGDIVKFEKVYGGEAESADHIRYQGKVIENTRISGYWWVSGQQRMNGRFFMWSRDYEIYSTKMIDQSNRNEGCLKAPLRIVPKKGKAVFWHNHHIDPLNGMVGAIHHEAISANCEVKQGEKWMASSWLNIIGDGELKLRTWRRGTNLLRHPTKADIIFRKIGTSKPKLEIEDYEKEYYSEVHGKQNNNNDNNNNNDTLHYGYQYKPASNALQALNLLINDLTSEQLSIITAKVHKILGVQCLPDNITF